VNKIYLTHFMGPDTPFYGSDGSFKIEPLRSMEDGDMCNANHWSFPNHAGTHIDFPRHFINNGKSIDDYSPDFWVFHNISIVEIPRFTSSSIIGTDIFETHRIPASVELLLLKTGYGSVRGTPAYWQSGPIFSPDLADYLRARFSHLRVFGFDAISVSSWTDRVTGREAHRAFLGSDRPILLLEDMDLTAVSELQRISKITVAPLLVTGADASPCTIIAEVAKP